MNYTYIKLKNSYLKYPQITDIIDFNQSGCYELLTSDYFVVIEYSLIGKVINQIQLLVESNASQMKVWITSHKTESLVDYFGENGSRHIIYGDEYTDTHNLNRYHYRNLPAIKLKPLRLPYNSNSLYNGFQQVSNFEFLIINLCGVKFCFLNTRRCFDRFAYGSDFTDIIKIILKENFTSKSYDLLNNCLLNNYSEVLYTIKQCFKMQPLLLPDPNLSDCNKTIYNFFTGIPIQWLKPAEQNKETVQFYINKYLLEQG